MVVRRSEHPLVGVGREKPRLVKDSMRNRRIHAQRNVGELSYYAIPQQPSVVKHIYEFDVEKTIHPIQIAYYF